jgi:hypothetical protein
MRLKKDDIRPNQEWEDKDEAQFSIEYHNNLLLDLPIEEEDGLNDPEMLIA